MEFSGFDELGQKNKILLLKNNLRGYSDCRKRYYDQKDEWLKKYRNQVGKATQYKGRLKGTADYYFEQLEKIYFCDLTAISSANPVPTKPPVATVSPSLITLIASSADTIFHFFTFVGGVGKSIGWETSFPAAISFMRHLPIGLNPFKALFS
jgi:hypothetical protein